VDQHRGEGVPDGVDPTEDTHTLLTQCGPEDGRSLRGTVIPQVVGTDRPQVSDGSPAAEWVDLDGQPNDLALPGECGTCQPHPEATGVAGDLDVAGT
jgi:hypothetical protein